jgi:hypothetical protein
LHEQGIVDAIIASLQENFSADVKPDLEHLEGLSRSLKHSLYVTPPKPVLVPDLDATLSALYRAYVAPAGGGSRQGTKSAILDRVVGALRRSGVRLRRSQYVKDFMFDLVIDDDRQVLGEVLSFATGAAKWEQVENDAGHFLYGLERVGEAGFAVVEPPPTEARESARDAHNRVTSWLAEAKIPIRRPDEFNRAEMVQQVLPI